MQYVAFESSVQEAKHVADAAVGAGGLDLCGDADFDRLQQNDLLWIITRLDADRPMPALCGRLTVERVLPYTANDKHTNLPARADCTRLIVVDLDRSERCTPFACEMLISWEIWRKPFGGIRPLSDEQARTLERSWTTERPRTEKP